MGDWFDWTLDKKKETWLEFVSADELSYPARLRASRRAL